MAGRDGTTIRIEHGTSAALTKLAALAPQFSKSTLGDTFLAEAIASATGDGPAIPPTIRYLREKLGIRDTPENIVTITEDQLRNIIREETASLPSHAPDAPDVRYPKPGNRKPKPHAA